MNTENIQKFLMPPDEGGAYTDEKLAALLAHAQDGKLSYTSCCCLVGSVTANHPLRSMDPRVGDAGFPGLYPELLHIRKARKLDYAVAAEEEFRQLAYDSPQPFLSGHMTETELAFAAKEDAKRRERLIPLILAEMERREQKRQIHDAELVEVTA